MDRLTLQATLKDIAQNVYFQPPSGKEIVYPCIVYKLSDINTKHAGNAIYDKRKQYTVTVIDSDPDSLIPEAVLDLPLCSFDRFFTADNLNHYVLTLYF